MYVLIMSRRPLRENPHPIVASMQRNSFLETGAKSTVALTATGQTMELCYELLTLQKPEFKVFLVPIRR